MVGRREATEYVKELNDNMFIYGSRRETGMR